MVTGSQSDDVILPASSVVVQPLIPKLGHEVEEIRVRAAKNILFKLEHKLVCVSDLVHERQLLIGLLEWFNFSSVPLKREVLGLLERLAKHVSAAQTLISIGGVEFLSHLRQDTDPELYQSVDNVIHQLLSLPQETGSQHEQWCLYKTHEAHERDQQGHDVGLSADHTHTTVETFKTAQGHIPMSIVGAPQKTGARSSAVCCHVSPAKGFFSDQSSCSDRHQTGLDWGPEHSSLSSARLPESSFADTSRLMFFPWLSLSASDRHILSATSSRLQSRSASLVAKSCEFLSDVLFKDFPAQIFLQRPSVFQSLLELLDDTADEEVCLPLCSMLCLRDLCQHLHVRLLALSDPVLHCPDQDCWKSRLSPEPMESEVPAERHEVATSVRERGDGGVGSEDASSSSSERQSSHSTVEEDEDRLVTETLKFNQLSVEELCVTLLSRLTPLLQGKLGGNPTAVTTLVELLHHVLDLLGKVIPDGMWHDKTHAGTLMAPSLLSSMKCLGEVIIHHMREAGFTVTESSYRAHSLPAHRMAMVNLSSFLVQLLCITVPLDVAPRVIPSELGTVIWMLAADEILGQTHKHLRRVLLQYLAVLDQNSHDVYITATRVAEAMISTCMFLKTRRSKGNNPLSEQLEVAKKCIPSLAYHRSVEFIREALELCSRASQSCGQAKTVTENTQVITLQLLSHPDHVVRGHAYKNCLALVRAALKVSHVTEPQSTVCQEALFLLNPAVIYQFCAFGLYDENSTVQGVATEIITTLLLGRLSMSGEMWKRLLEAIIVPLPLLQGSTGLDTSLDQTLLETVSLHSSHVTAEGDLICLPVLERFRGTLRFMFVKDPRIRAKAFECLVLHLTKEGGSAQDWFRAGLSSKDLCDVFTADKLTCAMYSHNPVSHPSVNSEEVHKLYSIFNSRSIDVGLRKSSAQQLAIILQNPRWHDILLSENADEVILAILKEIIEVEGPLHTSTTPRPKVELVLPCLTMIRLLTEYNAACRRRLTQRVSVYSIVTKCVLLCQHTAQVQYEASCLMVLLLFSEVAMVTPQTEDSIPFSLPRSLVRRFQFPFNPPVHTAVSAHQIPGPDEPDPLTSEPAVSMLRMAWNLGWHESLERLCQIKGMEGGGASETDGCLPALQWRDLDQQLLRAGHVTTALTEFLESMKSAVSHHAVKVALTRLTEHLLTDLGDWDGKRHLCVEVLYSLKFDEALERYLQVVPNSPQDDELLIRVLKLLEILLTSPLLPPQTVVAWISRIVLQSEGPLMTLLRTVPEQVPQAQQSAGSQSAVESKKSLRKHILNFFLVFIRCLSRHTDNWKMDGERVFIGDLAHAMALNLDLADNPQYYELPVLERALQCLACITAQPRWSAYCRIMEGATLCSQMLSSLVQVVSAFHAGRLGASMSFMGKGVTFHASLCLVHLAYEMACMDSTEAWVSHWVHERNPSQDGPLPWLVPLVTDRWPDVRWMGLSVAALLARSAQGRKAVFEVSEDTGGGLWNLAFTILLDDAECGLVRQEAALLLCTLTGSGLVSTGSTAAGQSSKESVMEVDNLLSFLDELDFYRKFSLMLSNAADAMPTSQGTSRACQSTASVSRPTSSNSEIPYKPLLSSSRSVSVSSEATQTAVLSPSHTSVESNGVFSTNGHSAVLRSGGTPMSGSSSVQGSHWTQPSQTPTSLVPLVDERGLPSGMSNTSTSSWLASVTGSMTSVSNTMASGVTPGLVSAVARLFYNLILVAPERTCASLNKNKIENVFQLHLDSSGLQKFLGFYRNSSAVFPCWAEVMVPEVLGMYSSLVTSLDAMMRADHTVLFRLQQDRQLLHTVLALLTINVSDFAPYLQEHVTGVRDAVSRFLVTLLQKQGSMSVASEAEEALYQHWTHFTDVLVEALKTCSSPPSLSQSLLKILCLLLSAEGKRDREHKRKQEVTGARTSRLVTLLDTVTCSTRACPDSIDITDEGVEPSGSALCSVLLDAHKGSQSKQTAHSAHAQRVHVTAALSALLAVSRVAKNTALRAGLVETSLEQIKHLHVQMNMSSLQLGKGPSWKRKDEPLTTELTSLLALLKNFMYQSADVKAACAESGLVDVLHKLWAWCTVEQTLLTAVLSLLCTLTADGSKGCALLAGNTSAPGATTFMQSLLKYAAKTSRKMQELSACVELDKHVTILRALFSLLSNLALSSECRGVIWKSNFLQHFSSLKPLKSNQTKQRSAARTVAQSWLSLLVNLTWFADGQQMVTKTTSALDVLLELSHARHIKHVHDHALLVLRNLCFHAASKPILLASERILAQFVESVSSGSLYTRALAVSALCSLLHNCHKAKVSMKTVGLLNRLDEIKLQAVTAGSPTDDKHYKIFCEGLETLEKAFREQKSTSGI